MEPTRGSGAASPRARINTNAWSNLSAARYLYDNIDFEVPEIRELKLTLK